MQAIIYFKGGKCIWYKHGGRNVKDNSLAEIIVSLIKKQYNKFSKAAKWSMYA